ncbi:MAG: single-stranded-DNA-specific exonuclease RecJ [Clostridia bacterium]|nr:single-stranded-DNA-specific exonuclease RecJ [Clostridia bacterium]
MKFTEKKKVWSLRYTPGNREIDEAIDRIARENGISRVAAGIIYNRGYETANAASIFLTSSISELHDPRLMKDMDRAVARVERALAEHERITVYGDYDVDGVTAVTLIYLYLKSRGADINYYIPSRSKEGYGLSEMALDNLKKNGTDLIVTVDTGITANAEAEYAKALGMEMVITDHHECHACLPDACAVVNPHRPDCEYPFKELAGVGVVFKLVCALEISRCKDESPLCCVERIFSEYADLAAIGTVADVMPLSDENRVIVKHGLAALSETERCGLAALIEAASNPSNARNSAGDKLQKKRKINAGFIGFALAPRINAAGRISSAEKAVALLLSDREDEAALMAQELCEINLRRQKEENSIAEEAYKIIEETHDFENDKVIVLHADNWQQGIIGIVSSRITERYGLPSILISFDGATEDVGKGSGRSIKGMNLVDALGYCSDLLVRFGGHELAAGLSVSRSNIDEFRKRINEYAREQLTEDMSCIRYEVDCEVDAEDIGLPLAQEIATLEPFGVANPTPVFLVKNMTVNKIISMGAGKHSKLLLTSSDRTYQAVCFGMAPTELEFYPGEQVDLLCQINVNEFRGQSTVQLVVQDVRLSGECLQEYDSEEARYREILDGASFSHSEDVIPTRSDIAEIYRLLRQECVGGHTSFTYRMLRSKLGEYAHMHVSYTKLRFAISILDDIRVCGVDEEQNGCISVEVYRNAAKTNIELSETYKRLLGQCGA